VVEVGAAADHFGREGSAERVGRDVDIESQGVCVPTQPALEVVVAVAVSGAVPCCPAYYGVAGERLRRMTITLSTMSQTRPV
jgi:hypothetical protein